MASSGNGAEKAVADKKIRDIRTEAIVLRRTNYGEADRILAIITPMGRRVALAKGVRKEKSRLAGAVEPFSLIEMNLHVGRGELLILTGAKCKKYYSNILKDFGRLEVASQIIKYVAKISDIVDNPEHFGIVEQCLVALDGEGNVDVILTWFYLNMAKVGGEEMNLHFDTEGKPLEENVRYVWDFTEGAMRKEQTGKIGSNEIKMLRIMLSAKLELVLRVKEAPEMSNELLYIAKTLNQL